MAQEIDEKRKKKRPFFGSPGPSPSILIVLFIVVVTALGIESHAHQPPLLDIPTVGERLRGERSPNFKLRRKVKSETPKEGQVDVTDANDYRGVTLWYNSSNTQVATYTFQMCKMIKCPDRHSRAAWFRRCYGTGYICVTDGYWGNQCGHWGSVGWNTGNDWGYKPQSALNRKDKNGKSLISRMTLLCTGAGNYVLNIENPSPEDGGNYVFGVHWGGGYSSWLRTFRLLDMYQNQEYSQLTNVPTPSTPYTGLKPEFSIIRAIADPTYEDTLHIETGQAETNLWLEWMRYTVLQHNMTDCYVCAGARPHLGTVPLTLPTNTEECFLSLYIKATPPDQSDDCQRWKKEYPLQVKPVTLNTPVTVYKGNYTCHNGTSQGIDVKSFPAGYCATYSTANRTYLENQTRAVGDVYWLCGDLKLRAQLPKRWKGECALTKVLMPIHIFKSGDEPHSPTPAPSRRRREIQGSLDPHVYLDAIGVPRGVPDEFKARNQIAAGFESLVAPIVTINKNVDWINYIFYNQQRFVNYTRDALKGLAAELGPNSKMTFQNRMMLDMMLAEKGGVCKMLQLTDTCCTFIPSNTGPNGQVTKALAKLEDLSIELKKNSGVDTAITSWFEGLFSSWTQALKTLGIIILVVLVFLLIIACCIAPLIKKAMTNMMLSESMYNGLRKEVVEADYDDASIPVINFSSI